MNDFFKKMMKLDNPKNFVMNMLGQNIENPMINNLLQMMERGDVKSVENFARNFCNERGRDFDKEFSEFMKKVSH